jgi:ketosteroid isomerase-like protein
MSHIRKLALLALMLALSACDPAARQAAEAQKLLATDQAFAAASVRDGTAAAFFQTMTADALQLPASDEPVDGRENVRARLLALGVQRLDWTPRRAEVSRALDMGWTWGEWKLYTDASRSTELGHGKYLNVWKRQPDRGWKLVVDIGNEAAPPPVPAAPAE